ncbi:hypothetical protein [Flectobacillus roseus]|uniref:Uncharacterized protein n=1 Tax=Flectobacillus roseus TaxID=502259 RepID=A0ABT6YGB1_9BACT|nr:hypothetical protein [Flectobacillus roseus]MDI9862196.1 hypothetical protein [Flectobacillus roseus]
MKKILILSIIVLLGFWACQSPLEGFELGFKDPIEKAKIEIHFYNPSGSLPTDLKISFAGPDSNLVVTNLNTKKFKVSPEGLLIVAVSPEVIPSSDKPVKFTIVADASGFTKSTRMVVFTNQSNQGVWIPMFNENNPPAGVSSKEVNIPNTQGGVLSANQTISTGTQKPENASLVLVAGTQLTDIENKPVAGNLNVSIQHFDNRGATRGFLPTGGVATNPVDANGKSLANPFDLPNFAGFVSIVMSNDQGQIVKKLSKPLELSLELNPATYNPRTKTNIKAGDMLPIFSFDIDKYEWKAEGESKIIQEGSKLITKLNISHLTDWIAGWDREICRQGPTFVFKSNFTDVDLGYYCQIVNSRNSQLLSEFAVGINNNWSYTLSYLPKDADYIMVKVFNFNTHWGGDRINPVASTRELEFCNPQSVEVDVRSIPTPPSVEVAFDIVCSSGKKVDVDALPATFKIQYSEVGKNNWQELIEMRRPNTTARTYKVREKNTYDFRASTDGGVTWPYKQLNKYLESTRISYRIEDKGFCK